MRRVFVMAARFCACHGLAVIGANAMRTLASLIMFVLTLTACSGCESGPAASPQPWGLEYISGATYKEPGSAFAYHFTVKIRVGGKGHAVQELTDHQFQLVEVMPAPAIDTHVGAIASERHMTIYLAHVQGVAFNAAGQGLLPDNGQGYAMFPASGPHPYNSGNMPVGGQIVSRGPALQWSLIADASGVTVTLPSRVVFIPAP